MAGLFSLDQARDVTKDETEDGSRTEAGSSIWGPGSEAYADSNDACIIKWMTACSPPSRTVIAIVGKERQKYLLHRDVALKCPFFATCLEHAGTGCAPRPTEMLLPEDDSRGFDLIAHYLYGHDIFPVTSLDKSWVLNNQSVATAMHVHILADKYGLIVLQNRLIDELAQFWDRCFIYPRHVIWVAQHAHQESAIYRLVLDTIVHTYAHIPSVYLDGAEKADDVKFSWYVDAFMELLASGRIAVDILGRAAQLRDTDALLGHADRCRYHAHPVGTKCDGLVGK